MDLKARFARLTGKHYAMLSAFASGQSITDYAIEQGVTLGSIKRRVRHVCTVLGITESQLIPTFEAWRRSDEDLAVRRTADLIRPLLANPEKLRRLRG
ncbi:hypothetical protein [Novosphingobium cyanobacteriorum]|uniref:Conjugal transfer protein TraJ n=1 Tax=Novosphingobium cyanobacteriorum TaxID=3024215 RepID=A0ABT6CMX9_9SPHN|nr:hypothetical protein [Novosphingobium cyanobacteriorum]MDF8335161.1 hypothetical protein [Novosphingobium cyanobacteriorum]